ncbi:MAG: serine hydrolase [Candidatus Methanomethylicia archaeon]|nr:serine hydrolase [Candidatus Methanomethylicia archaeon]
MSLEFEKVKRYIESEALTLMKTFKIPGFSISIVDKNRILYSEGFGYRNLERFLPASPNTLYGLGSTTKSFVALSIMQLVETGRLSLDDPVSNYVPLKIGLKGKPIRIRHLLSHSSGIPDLGTSTILLQSGIGFHMGIPLASVNDFYRFINDAQNEIVDEPGKRYFYLNEGYRMLGHIIQKVSGLPFHIYVTENVLKPLKMFRSTFVKSVFEKDVDRITPYRLDESGKHIPTPFPYPNVEDNLEFSFISAPGGLISSVAELSNYLICNLNWGVFENNRIISRESLEEMFKIHVEIPRTLYGKHGYGFGWHITEDFFGTKLISHGGSILVSTSHLSLLPEYGFGVAMAANIAGFPYDEFSQAIYAIFLGRDPYDIPQLKVKKKMNMLCGQYSTYKGVDNAEIVSRGGMLYLIQKGILGTITIPLIPEDPLMESNKFYIYSNGIKQLVEFVVYSDGRIDLYIERDRYHKIK